MNASVLNVKHTGASFIKKYLSSQKSLIADQAKRILEPMSTEHVQVQPLIANYQQFLNWEKLDK